MRLIIELLRGGCDGSVKWYPLAVPRTPLFLRYVHRISTSNAVGYDQGNFPSSANQA